MLIELQRTFGEYTEPQLRDDEVDWSEYFGSKRGRLTWKELHQKRVVVVLGEAGIGKTTEFELEAKRLTEGRQSAFFLPLNLLRTTEEWQYTLGSALEAFSTWKAGTGEGFFFLDAVDEARLQTHADFTRALQIVRGALAGHMARVRIAISSRVTDWTVPQVAASLATQLLQPLLASIPIDDRQIQQIAGTGREGKGQGQQGGAEQGTHGTPPVWLRGGFNTDDIESGLSPACPERIEGWALGVLIPFMVRRAHHERAWELTTNGIH